MADACLMDILALPQDDLKKVLPKASARSLAKLVIAYPRAVGKTFMDILTECMSAPTIAFIHEEIEVIKNPSYVEIRSAESEIMKIIRDENLEDHLVALKHAK
jgi:hypothetical protein